MPTRMPTHSRYSLRSLLTPASLARLALIGAILLLVVVAFVWAGGFFSTGHLDQTRIIDAFEADSGVHPGFRRNHAKGVCLAGWFDGNGAGTSLSRAALFQRARTLVFGRFSLPGGMPMMEDTPSAVHAMALDFALPDGEVWRTAMVDLPVFPMSSVRAFYDQLVASKPDPRTGKPDPAKMKAFLASHPTTARALGTIKAHPFASVLPTTPTTASMPSASSTRTASPHRYAGHWCRSTRSRLRRHRRPGARTISSTRWPR